MIYGNEKDHSEEEIVEGVYRKNLFSDENLQLCWLKIGKGEIPEHAHPNEQVGYILKGKMESNIGGEKGILEPGSYFFIPGNASHSGYVYEYTIMIEIYSPPR